MHKFSDYGITTKTKQGQQIMLKLEWKVILALNIKTRNIKKQTKPVYDLYKDSLDIALDSNINDLMANTINTNYYSSRQITLATQLRTHLNILLSSKLFSELLSGGDKNSSFCAKRSILLILLKNIVSRELLKSLFWPFGNKSKLRKRKLRAVFISWGLRELGNIID